MQHRFKNQNFKVAFYVRVSTEEQAENPEGSIKNQEDRLRHALNEKNKFGSFGELKEIYTDAGISAKNMKRPALQKLLQAIRSKEIDLVMVTELSRFSRNTRDFIQMWDMIHEHGCLFKCLKEDFDTTTAAGELLLFQLMNLSQFERRQTSERVEANLQTRAARGLYNGGPIPAGYKSDKEKPGYLLIDVEMAEVVKIAFATFIREGTLGKTVIALNDSGHRLRKQMEGGGHLKRIGLFTVDNLQAILRNKAYIGTRVYKVKGEAKEVRAVWPAIIDEAIFNRAGEILEKNRSHLKTMGPKKKLPYILTGITVCARCGDSMCGKSATGHAGKIGYYEHAWATKRDSGLSKKIFRCEPHRILAKKIEPLVWEKFLSFVTDTHFMKGIFEKAKELHQINPHRKEMDRLKAKIHGLNSQIEALAERLAEIPKSVSAAPIYKQMERLETLKAEHQAAMAQMKSESGLDSRIASLDTFEDFAKAYRKILTQDLNPDQKKQTLQKFIRKIEVGVDSVKIHFIVDEDHFKNELAIKRQSSAASVLHQGSESDFFRSVGSNTLTIGARRGT